jgi:AraC-like DNA-binding protein
VGTPWSGVHYVYTDSGRHYGRHWHAGYGIGLLDHGAHASASGRGVVRAYAGDLITTNPGEVHDGRPVGVPSRRWRIMHLEPAVLASMNSRPATSDMELTRPVFQDRDVRLNLRRLFARVESWDAGQTADSAELMACDESLVRTCALLLSRYATNAHIEDRGGDMSRVRERLADELLNPPTLTHLAAMIGVSRYQLLRRFEGAYGVPPHRWLLVQRAEKARGLIRKGWSLAEAAAAAGFADQSHMTRHFVRQFGFTPGAWRSAAAGLQFRSRRTSG